MAAEQAHVDRAYRSLDAELGHARERLRHVLLQPASDSTALVEREGEAHRLTGRVTSLQNAEQSICFGRLDRRDGGRLYIGRAGISEGDQRLVIDWRAPAAEPFYAATPREPLGLVRRRNLTVTGRRVVRIDDDLLDSSTATSDLVGEGALMRSLTASRDGRMRDAVATLQAEQDAIVRSPLAGVLVVQGAPGTGKTVVALHRAAYLLYRAPELLRRGVLMVGPNRRFLDYIGDVLPALGETNVVMSTVEDLYPHPYELGTAAPDVARLLGDARMATAVRKFILDRQGNVPEAGKSIVWDGEDIPIPSSVIARCAEAARNTRELHNIARATFVSELLDELVVIVSAAEADRMAGIEEGLDQELSDFDSWLKKNSDSLLPRRSEEELAEAEQAERRHLRQELEDDEDVQRVIDSLWPYLTPEQAVQELLSDGLHDTAAHLTAEERTLLADATSAWTDAHIPLLDEAAELLGSDESAALAAGELQRRRELAFAQQVLQANPSLRGWMSAEMLAEQNAAADHRGLAERALADRTWTYGHVIVDEAQELSPMQWRMVARHCPTKSMTIVGDIAQTSARGAETASWQERLTELGGNQRLVELTVCYRSPRELVDAVEPLLRTLRPQARRIDAIRVSGRQPELIAGEVDELAQIVGWLERSDAEGQHAIITPDPDEVRRVLDSRGVVAADDDLRQRLVVLAPVAAKGLEFDHVLVHAPSRIAAADGLTTAYVALTRSTGTLTVVQTGTAPDFLGEGWTS